MAPQHVEWPTEWGVLLALTLPADREIYSKVRLNKIIALLQRDGFPISNRFYNSVMGPMDFTIHGRDAPLLEKEGLISTDEKPMRNKNPVTSYRLTDKGLGYFQQKYSCIIDSLPYKPLFNATMDEVRRSFHMTTSEIVDRVHEELMTQVAPEVLRQRMMAVAEMLERTIGEVERYHDDSCPVCVEVLGSSEFAIKSIKKAVEQGLDNKSSGKNMVYYNSHQVLHWAQKLARHNHVTDVRLGDDGLSRLRMAICYRLYCLEENAGRYGIAEPIRDESGLSVFLQQQVGGEI